ncbi:sensor histidine kinase [Deinococcus misasensis]|uniref:sensor histidine kinase n=1 Tax=Deinococcus misasensis TaxID=392413 RepID=UPI0005569C2F|nr:HAMP domain-containing sensor histidine kinase [Deinococcus misasensis]
MRFLSVVLLLLGFVLDVVTHSSLVVGILLNVPLVLSGLTLSRHFLLQMTVLTLVANVLAGVINGFQDGNSLTTLINRLMVVVSLFLVGFLSLRMQDTTLKAALLQAEEERAQRESKLRSILNAFTAVMSPEQFLAQTVRVLLEATRSGAVLVLREDQSLVVGTPVMQWTSAKIQLLLERSGNWVLSWEGFVVLLDRPEQESVSWVQEVLSDLTPLYGQAVLRESLESQRAQLQDRSEVIRDLMYAFSHDLRTPILANVMSMKLALSGTYGPIGDEYQSALRNGIQANQDVLSLAESLLQVAKLEIEGEGVPLGRVNLSGLVGTALLQVQPLMLEKHLRVQQDLSGDVWVLGDAAQLRRVVLNLLDNAIKWSPVGGTLEVRMERKGRFVMVGVLDEGPGVPEGMRGHLFHRFRKAGAGAGSGLGLYLASKIMRVHGGRLAYIRSEGRTEFCFTLPEEQA